MNDVQTYVEHCQKLQHVQNTKINHRYNGTSKGEYVYRFIRTEAGRKWNGLFMAISKEHVEIVSYLLGQDGVDLSLTNDQGWNALHFAAYHNRRSVAILNLLIQILMFEYPELLQKKHQEKQ